MMFPYLALLATATIATTMLATPLASRHPRIMELEGKMMNGNRLSDEESRKLGKLHYASSVPSTNPASPLLVKRDSCPNCSKDYQYALLSCSDFCKSCDNLKCGVCGGWLWHTCYCYSNEGNCDE
ncbi:hypothetical protein BG015_009835 [Linnemannia schmuckeri]|uniref:Uncharacterized protein n=1 Tax=Linnemannia schmuckeri TaxID=64567 RepID=A0A9P5RUV6_9FUNG|nr:hypothetical protein BG015_009835 [Linnemannia schmuckeri]